MKGVLPIIIVCVVGIIGCFSFVGYVFAQHLKKKHSRKKQVEYELDDKTLVIKLGEEDFRK